MKFTELELAGAFVIDLEPHTDTRGFFARTFCARELHEHGLAMSVTQESISFNAKRGTVRGMHYQAPPHVETKLVRCTAGSVYDVIVDLRSGSASYGKWTSVELSAKNRRALYVPAGVAHGFQTLSDETELLYGIDVEFVVVSARGIRWDDPALAIDWPIRGDVTISPRDAQLPSLSELRAGERG